MVTKGGRNETIPNYLYPGKLRLLHFASATLPTACGCHHRLLDLVFIVVSGVVVGHQALEVVAVLESYDLPLLQTSLSIDQGS